MRGEMRNKLSARDAEEFALLRRIFWFRLRRRVRRLLQRGVVLFMLCGIVWALYHAVVVFQVK